VKTIYLFLTLIIFSIQGLAQEEVDSVGKSEKMAPSPKVYIPKDSVALADSMRRAKTRRVTRHSALVPGWGQLDNRQAWKLPIIYGALGFTTYLFFDNVSTYRELRAAYIVRTDTIPGNDQDMPERFQPLSTNSIRFYRDQYRQNVDYTVLAFFILWGLNVVDAAVFANLRDFDVSDQISLRLKAPSINIATGQSQLGMAIQLKHPSKTLKPLPAR
jgi:hypothetical protein